MAAASPERPWITCHVLDTTTGKPATGIHVELTLLSSVSIGNLSRSWHAKTNEDGRVASWSSTDNSGDFNQLVNTAKQSVDDDEALKWILSFQTEGYFGKGNTFWPEVQLAFAAKKTEVHYHVPLLLGPWSYTTYRGS